MRPWAGVVAVWAVAVSTAPTVAADLLRIEGVVWGYDGTVMVNAFNPVSFELHNDSNDPMNLPLRLTKSDGVTQVDAPIGVSGPNEPVYLAAQSSRRVQLFAYVQSQHNEFALSWGRDPSQRLDLTGNTQLTVGPPATVILYDPDAVLPRGSGLPRFDESFFPISVSGTSGLAAVVLDHAPRWQTSQQQAFLDWLRSGGLVHVVSPTAGAAVQFDGELAALNSPLEEQRVGVGRIVRHPQTMAGVDRAFVETNILPRNSWQLKPAPAEAEAQDQSLPYGYFDSDIAGQLFARVKQLTRPDHNWTLIYLMSLVYLLLIFPGCWLIGRRKADYRLTYGVMLAAVALFSMGFKTVGQRGYGEQTALHALTIARPLDGERLQFRQWANLFATDGDDYRITHAGNGLLYSSGQSTEAVRGWIVSPPAGEFVADVPPFSSRTIAAAGVADAGGFTVQVEELKLGENLESLIVRTDPPLSALAGGAHAMYRDQLYVLAPMGEGRYSVASGSASGAWTVFLQIDQWHQYGNNWGMGGNPDINESDILQSAMRPMIAADAGVFDEPSYRRFQRASDRVRVYLYADMPESLFASVEYASTADRPLPAKRVGRVLYAFDVTPPQ